MRSAVPAPPRAPTRLRSFNRTDLEELLFAQRDVLLLDGLPADAFADRTTARYLRRPGATYRVGSPSLSRRSPRTCRLSSLRRRERQPACRAASGSLYQRNVSR